MPQPIDWLSGRPSTVIMGLIYGYIPYMVLPLYAFLDRIDDNLLEAGRDLGAESGQDVLPRHPAALASRRSWPRS